MRTALGDFMGHVACNRELPTLLALPLPWPRALRRCRAKLTFFPGGRGCSGVPGAAAPGNRWLIDRVKVAHFELIFSINYTSYSYY